MENIELYQAKNTGIVFTENEKIMNQALLSQKIKDLMTSVFLKEIIKLVKAAYFKSGFQIQGLNQDERNDFVILLAESICKDLLQNYNDLGIQEIEIAFDKGVMKRYLLPDGKYNDYKTLSTYVFSEWVRLYKIERQELLHKKKQIEYKLQSENKIEISEIEKEKIIHNYAIESYKEFTKKGFFNDFGNVVYDYLDSKGLIKFTNEEKQEFMTLAKMEIYENKPTNEFQEIIKAIENKDKKTINVIVSQAKKLALNEYFKKIDNLII